MGSRTVTIIVAVVLAGVLAAGTAGAAIIVAPPNTSDGRTYSLIDNVFGGNPPEYVEAATGTHDDNVATRTKRERQRAQQVRGE